MKHYVFLTNVPQNCGWGGCEQLIFDYFGYTDFASVKITAAVTQDIITTRLRENNLPVEVMPYPFEFSGKFVKRFSQMYKFLKSLSADGAVFVQNDFLKFALPEFAAAYFATGGNVYSIEVLGAPRPVRPASRIHFKVVPGMAMSWRIEQMFLRSRGRFCRKVLAVSEEVKERIVKWYHYPAKKFEVVYCGVDCDNYRPDEEMRGKMRSRYGMSENDVVIVSTARLCEQKRLDRLINAFDEVYRGSDNLWLYIVGDGPLREELGELASSKSSAGRIKFVGHHDDVTGFLQMSDIYVLPSQLEGLGIAMLEAMSTGLVVVATKTPGPKEVIDDSVNGFLVEQNERAVADGLRKALSLDESQRTMMTSAARQLVRAKFSLQNCTHKALNVMGIDFVAGQKCRFPAALPGRAVSKA